MSSLTIERDAVKESIAINPLALTVSRATISQNARNVDYENWSSPSPVVFTNSVRIVLMSKPASKIVENEGKYNNTKTYYIITDYETVILKHDRFTWNNKDWEILDVESITIYGGIKNYQAELMDLTQKVT